MKKKGDELEIRVVDQGTPKASIAYFLTEFDGTQEAVVVNLDVYPKYCADSGFGYDYSSQMPTYYIEMLSEDESTELDWTIVGFPTLKGYKIVATRSGRYTHTVALIKVD